jgi:hypothetical protein
MAKTKELNESAERFQVRLWEKTPLPGNSCQGCFVDNRAAHLGNG